MEIITPGRICLFGEHQDYLGLPVIALAISLHSKIKFRGRKDDKVVIRLPDINHQEVFSLKNLEYTKERDYFRSALKVCIENGLTFSKGFECTITSTIPIGAGTSSSSSIVVGFINLLSSIADNPTNWDRNKLGEVAYQAEVIEFDEPGGMMDQFSTAMGGCIHIEQQPLEIRNFSLNLKSFVLGHSHEPKDTLKILKHCRDKRIGILQKIQNKNPLISFNNCSEVDGISVLNNEEKELFRATVCNREITQKAIDLINQKEFDHYEFGRLLFEHHMVLSNLLGTSTPKIDKMIEAGIEAGAYGGKINGSGGGGCMFVYAPESPEKVAEAIESVGGTAYIIHADQGTRKV